MIRSRSLASDAGRGYAIVPLSDATRDAPAACISLLGWGDMWGGGNAATRRRELYAAIGIEERRVRSLNQVHSKRVLVADELDPAGMNGQGPEGDALVTSDERLVLGVRVADCYPILLFDRVTKSRAAAHSGWRGTGIVGEVLALMSDRYGTRPENVAAVVGPGIRSCCYDVPLDRAELFGERFGADSVVQRAGRHFLDLAAANLRLLEETGVSEITFITDCTSCSPFLGSFRRQGPEAFVHMLALIGQFS